MADDDDDDLTRFGRRVREEPVARHFDAFGWSLLLFPVDLFESRVVAKMFVWKMLGFPRESMCELRARRLAIADEPERTWWVIAVPRELTRERETAT